MSYFGSYKRAVSSAVEHCFHTAGVTGSIPVPPTIPIDQLPDPAAPKILIRALARISFRKFSRDVRFLIAQILDLRRRGIWVVARP
jgi:hypothetical protein